MAEHQPTNTPGSRKATSARARRKTAFEASHVGLDRLMGFTVTPDTTSPTPTKMSAALMGLAGAALLGLLVSLVPVPFIGASAITLREASDYWDNLPTDLPTQALPQRSIILAADGTQIAEFYSENRVPVSLDQVPQSMQDALVAIEDARFFDHNGVDCAGHGPGVGVQPG